MKAHRSSQQQLLQACYVLVWILTAERWGEIYILAFDKESSVWMNSRRIFGTIATQSSFWPFIARPTGPPLEGRKGMSCKPSLAKGCSWITSNHKETKWTKWDSGRPHNKTSEAAMCTSSQRLFSSTTSQMKLLHSTDRALDSDRMRGGQSVFT